MARLIDPFLHYMVEYSASDLFLTVGCAPSLRVHGRIRVIPGKPAMDIDTIHKLVDDLLSEDQRDEFESTLELNIALALHAGEVSERFRVNLFKQRHRVGLVVRMIKSVIPSFEELGLPKIFGDFILEKRGLVLMVGATGSGKSTSLAAMLEYRNTNGSGHIVTVEDPIEYIFAHKNCIFTQREIGIDTYSYGIGLKSALRQSPDVLAIGEIRDRETLENALLFSETGHLVVATLHANNSNQAIERIVNLFPEEMHKQVLITLSQNIRAIVSQRLVQNVHDGLTLAYEILINEGLAKVLIEEGKIKELKDIMERSVDQGMMTFDHCLFSMVMSGEITEDVGLREADNPNNLRLRLKQAKILDINKYEPPMMKRTDGNF